MAGDNRQRIDKWLWFARLAKTRTLAQKLALSGRVRVNRDKNETASRLVKIGDVLTVTGDAGIRVLRIVATGSRRGPPAEARLLYEDLSPPKPADALTTVPAARRAPGAGRPTKRERRALDSFRLAGGDDFPGTDD